MRFKKFTLSIFAFSICANLTGPSKLLADAANPAHQSYLAHIAAANASLRLNEPFEARRWLEATPVTWRGWEYQYLAAELDKSLGVFDSLPAKPLSQDFSSDGKLLAVACEDNVVRIYDFDSKKVVTKLEGHRGAVYSAQFFPANDKILTCSRDSMLRIWDLTGQLLNETPAGGHGLQYADISPAGDKIAYSSWKKTESGIVGIVSLWDAVKLEKVWETDFDVKPIVKVKFSPDGSQFAIGTWNWKVAVWDTNKPGKPKVFDFDDVTSYSAIDDIAFSPDGKKIAAATRCGTPRVWEIATGKKLAELHGHDKPVMSVAFSHDGNLLYTGGSDATIGIWDINTGMRIGRLSGHSDAVNAIEFRPVNKVSGALPSKGANQLATISSDNTIRIWDAATDLEFTNPAGRAPNSYGLCLSSDGNILATGGKDGTVSIWNSITGELINNFAALPSIINAAALSPGGKRVFVCNWDSTVKILDVSTGQVVHDLKGVKVGGASCTFSPDGLYAALGSSNNGAFIWIAETGNLSYVLNHPGSLSYVTFSRNGEYFLTAAGNGLVTVWSSGLWQNVTSIDDSGIVHCIDFSPDNTSFVTVGRSGRPKIWSMTTGQLLMEFGEHSSLIWSVAFSPQGDRIATGSADNTIRIWDVSTGVCTLIISDLGDPVYNLAFSPDGTRLYANSSGTELKVFDTVPVKERIKSLTSASSK